MKTGFAICFAISFILLGCATTQSQPPSLTSWQGKSVQALQQAWGAPNNTIKKENHTLYIYTTERIVRTPTYPIPSRTTVTFAGNKPIVSTSPGGMTGGEPQLFYCRHFFEVDQRHIIINAYSEGNDCSS